MTEAMYIHRMGRMVRKQVYLSTEQNVLLRRAAARQRRSEAEVLRDALDRHLGAARPVARRLEEDPIWEIVGITAGDDGRLSERVDDLLYGRRRR